jgi:hypothetical protein
LFWTLSIPSSYSPQRIIVNQQYLVDELLLRRILEVPSTFPKEMLYLDAQRKKPLKDDWCTTVMEDLEDLKLNLNFDEIKKMSENQLKQKIRISVTCKAMD